MKLSSFTAVVAGLLVLGSVSPLRVDAQALRADQQFFRDERGAVVILRGLNVAGDAKVPPFRPIDDPHLLDRFPAWGVNVARLLFTWEAFEPARGSYDETYLAYYVSLIDALHARGVYVIVDVHQDAYSRFLMDGCGEGFPEWTVSPNVKKRVPDNGSACSSWGLKLILDTDMHRAWDDFYADVGGVRSAYLLLLDALSARLSTHPAVIGYDMINEPWADEVTQLAPLHEDGARVIRANHPESILFLSPQALTSSGQDTKLPRASFGNFAYAPHYYDAGLVTLSLWAGGSLNDPIERMASRARSWNVPLLLGEFGAPGPARGAADYLDAFYRELDLRFASASQWAFVAHWQEERKDGWNVEDYSIVDGQGALRANYRVRPYPARISGDPIAFEVTRSPEPSVSLTWSHAPESGETRIFAPRLLLFGGEASVDTQDPVRCAYEHDLRHVRCESDSVQELSIVLRRCAAGETCLTTLPPPRAPVDETDAGPARVPAGGDASVAADGAPDVADPQVTAPAQDSKRHRGGCSVAPGAERAALPAGIIGLLLNVTLRRRRRPRG